MRIFRRSLFVGLIFGVILLAFLNAPGVLDAQQGPTPPPSPTPTATASPTPVPHLLTIFRDVDTFTLYAPAQGEISLARFTFAVSDQTYALESFSAFRGLPFNPLPTPICFRLTRSGANSPLPLDCTSALILTQTLANADVFWYDSVLSQDFVVLIQLDGATQGICASGQSECDIQFAPGEVTPTPTASVSVTLTLTGTAIFTNEMSRTITPTDASFCAGEIQSINGAQTITSVYLNHNRLSRRDPVQSGQYVVVLERFQDGNEVWFKIGDTQEVELGWVEARYLPNCR